MTRVDVRAARRGFGGVLFTFNSAEELIRVSSAHRLKHPDHGERVHGLVIVKVWREVVAVGVEAQGHGASLGVTMALKGQLCPQVATVALREMR